MPLFLHCPDEPLARQAFYSIASMLAAAWTDKDDNQGRRDFHFESDCDSYLSRFLLKLPIEEARKIVEPVLNCVEKAPKEVGDFVKQLIYAADTTEAFPAFWSLWYEFSAGVLRAPWLDRLDDRYSRDQGLLRAMFLNIHWKEGITHWRGSEGRTGDLEDFFAKLPPAPAVFSAYTSFLFNIGERSLPKSFQVLESRLRAGAPDKILADRNIVFCMETILRRHVYGKPDVLKRNSNLRTSVLY